MAKLEDKESNLLFNLILYPDSKSYDWVSYEIIIGPESGNRDLSFCLSGDELYFEACQEHEVLQLCYGIEEVLNGKKNFFFFEPVDQEDFQFMIKEVGCEEFSVSIHSEHFSMPKNYNRPEYSYIGVNSVFKKEEVLNFVNQLKKEYKEIIGTYPKNPNCTPLKKSIEKK